MEKGNLSTDALLTLAVEAAKKAGAFLRSHTAEVLLSRGKDVKITADVEAHRIIRESLSTSEIPILSEEDTVHDFGTATKWIIDPLDGSLNFSRGIPNYAISIALVKNDEPVLGVVYDFNREDMYSGIVGQGAWLNGTEMHTSNVQDKSDAVIMTGFPSFTDYSSEALQNYIKNVQSFKKVRLIGSAALSLAYVASGRADAYYEKDIKIWDVAAGLALVKAAGGTCLVSAIDEEGRCAVSVGNTHRVMH